MYDSCHDRLEQPHRKCTCMCYQLSDSFSASIFCVSVLPANLRSSVLTRPGCFLNPIQCANIPLILGHFFIITSSRHSTRLLLSALPFRNLHPTRNYRCTTMAQVTVLTNGTKTSVS